MLPKYTEPLKPLFHFIISFGGANIEKKIIKRQIKNLSITITSLTKYFTGSEREDEVENELNDKATNMARETTGVQSPPTVKVKKQTNHN